MGRKFPLILRGSILRVLFTLNQPGDRMLPIFGFWHALPGLAILMSQPLPEATARSSEEAK